jgi:hypothetical protein
MTEAIPIGQLQNWLMVITVNRTAVAGNRGNIAAEDSFKPTLINGEQDKVILNEEAADNFCRNAAGACVQCLRNTR